VIGSIDTLVVSPFISINGEDFNYIDNEKYRSGLLFEIDFLSYNFFKDLQNTVDIMFGLGYKLRKPSSKSIIPYVEGNPDNWFSDSGNIKETVYYNPTIHNFNLNTTFIFQATNHFYPYFHFSYGILQTYLFETEDDDLLVTALINRVKKNPVKEVILATSATIEGQTTAHYIQDSLKDTKVKISKLAQGVPVGGEIEFLDDGTLFSAFKNRGPVVSD